MDNATHQPQLNNLVPELRFPEFKSQWKKFRLDELAKIERGKFSPRPRNNPIYYGGKIPFVQTGDVVHSGGLIFNYSQTLNEKGLKVSKLFKKGTILITIAANIGYTGIIQVDMACPDSLIGIICKENTLNTFLNILLQIHQPRMDYLAVAAAQKNINIEFLKPYKLVLPTQKEQQKIANFLTAIDQRISLLKQKKAALEQYKKGLMQKIFSQEIRFKDDRGNDYPDWVENRLGEVVKLGSKKINPLSDDVNYKNIELDCIEQNTGQIHTYYDSKNQKSMKTHFKQGDILFGKLRPYLRKFYLTEFEGVCSTEIWVLKPKSVERRFLFYLIQSSRFNYEVNLTTGTRMPRADWKVVSGAKFEIPCPEEQQKITDCLSAIDQSINQLSKQIDQTSQFKKGLLQRMFV